MPSTITVSRPILYQGMGAPYVALFNPIGMPLLNALTGIPLGAYVTSFQEKTDTDEENMCTIKLLVGNPNTVDIDEIAEGGTIIVQWGYIFPDGSSTSGPALRFNIRDVDIIFNQKGTEITLKCVDRSNLTRRIPVWVEDPQSENTLEDFMDDGLGMYQGIVIEKFDSLANEDAGLINIDL